MLNFCIRKVMPAHFKKREKENQNALKSEQYKIQSILITTKKR